MVRAGFLLALAVLLASGCGGEGGPTGFLATPSDGAAFLQWTRSGDAVTGSLTITWRQTGSDGYEETETTNSGFTGVVSGSSVSLTLDLGGKWNGALDGDELTLTVADEKGSLQTLAFGPAEVSAYNAAVAELEAAVALANDGLAQAEIEAEAAEEIDRAGAMVADATADIPAFVEAARAAVEGARQPLAAERKALERTLAALERTVAARSGERCYESAEAVYYASEGVQYEKERVDGSLDEANANLATFEETLERLRVELGLLESALAAASASWPAGVPTKRAVSEARASAKAAVSKIVTEGRRLRREANALAEAGREYAERAQRACGE